MSSDTKLRNPDVYVTPTFNTHLQAAAARSGKPYPYYPHTTLNEILEINQDLTPHGIIPRAKYWAIGFDGTVNQDVSGRAVPVATYHGIKDMGAFGMIPFACVREDQDLSSLERSMYAMRERRVIDGIPHVLYWVMRLPDDGEPLTLVELTKINGEENRDEYIPRPEDKNPTKPALLPDGTNPTPNKFITTSDMAVCELNRTQIDRVIDAVEILHGSRNLAMITEIMIVQGVDKDVSYTDHNNQPFQFKEVVGAQVANFCCKANGSLIGDDQFRMAFDVGVTDVMAIA